jgi:putative two-component system response regulator
VLFRSGKGYPRALKGDEIPITARLASVADVYDALVSARIYKSAIPNHEAMKIIMDGRGTQFDPVICDAAVEIQDELEAIANRYK